MLLSVILLTIVIISSLGSPADTQTPQGSQSQQSSQPENTCNACCQGVPGPAGLNGLNGRDGFRGEKGNPGPSIKGDKGDIRQGLPGQEGQRGQTGLPGRGLPGKIGPRGPSGPSGRQGLSGEPGVDGSKGDKGESGRTRRSAFTAIKTSSQTGSDGAILTFNETPTNLNGDFSLSTHKFTCRVPGTYVFSYSIGVYQPGQVIIQLVKNGQKVVSAHTRTGGFPTDYDSASTSAILNLVTGDQVWLKFDTYTNVRVYSSAYNLGSFSGFLLYEN